MFVNWDVVYGEVEYNRTVYRAESEQGENLERKVCCQIFVVHLFMNYGN